MNVKEDSLSVIKVLYDAFENKKTLQTDLSYTEIHNALPQFDIPTIKALVEYLAGHGYVTFRNHPVFNDICITSDGIDFS